MVSIFSRRIWAARKLSRDDSTAAKPEPIPAYRETNTIDVMAVATSTSEREKALCRCVAELEPALVEQKIFIQTQSSYRHRPRAA